MTAQISRELLGRFLSQNYEYDLNDNPTTVNRIAGVQSLLNYEYDAANRATAITAEGESIAPTTIAQNIQYYPFGPIASISLGNGLTVSRTYNARYQLVDSAVTGDVLNWHYVYENDGDVSSIDDLLSGANNRSFAYDGIDRLISATGPGYDLGWTYDANGNRLTETLNAATTTYMYSPGSNRLASLSPGPTFQYHNAGAIIDDGTHAFGYSNRNRIGTVDGGGTASYLYDVDEHRVRKNTAANLNYQYDPQDRLILESRVLNFGDSIDSVYVWLGNEILARLDQDSRTNCCCCGKIYWYHNDHLTTPWRVTDTSGSIVWSAEYRPFGQLQSTSGSLTQNIRFPGQYDDSETTLHDNWQRSYSAPIGRYYSTDPLPLDRRSTYSYAASRPIFLTDPFGLFEIAANCDSMCGRFNMKDEIEGKGGIERFRSTINTPNCRSRLQLFKGFMGENLFDLLKDCDQNGLIICDCGDTRNYGKTPRNSLRPAITVCGGNFVGSEASDSPFQEGYGLGETIFHECLHWGRFGGTEPGSGSFNARLFRYLERKCYNWPPM